MDLMALPMNALRDILLFAPCKTRKPIAATNQLLFQLSLATHKPTLRLQDTRITAKTYWIVQQAQEHATELHLHLKAAPIVNQPSPEAETTYRRCLRAAVNTLNRPLTKVTQVTLEGMELSALVPEWLSKLCPNASTVRVHDCKLKPDTSTPAAPCTTVKHLDIRCRPGSFSPFRKSVWQQWASQLRRLTALERLSGETSLPWQLLKASLGKTVGMQLTEVTVGGANDWASHERMVRDVACTFPSLRRLTIFGPLGPQVLAALQPLQQLQRLACKQLAGHASSYPAPPPALTTLWVASNTLPIQALRQALPVLQALQRFEMGFRPVCTVCTDSTCSPEDILQVVSAINSMGGLQLVGSRSAGSVTVEYHCMRAEQLLAALSLLAAGSLQSNTAAVALSVFHSMSAAAWQSVTAQLRQLLGSRPLRVSIGTKCLSPGVLPVLLRGLGGVSLHIKDSLNVYRPHSIGSDVQAALSNAEEGASLTVHVVRDWDRQHLLALQPLAAQKGVALKVQGPGA